MLLQLFAVSWYCCCLLLFVAVCGLFVVALSCAVGIDDVVLLVLFVVVGDVCCCVLFGDCGLLLYAVRCLLLFVGVRRCLLVLLSLWCLLSFVVVGWCLL